MAVTYLNENATSLAAANWDDATGFAAGAQLIIADGSVATVDDVDQSASDVEYLVVTEGRTGDLGAAGTPVKFEADTPSGARVEYRASAGRFYGEASGVDWNTLIVNSKGGQMYMEGGTIASLEVAMVAWLHINASTVVTTAYLGAGRGVIENNATGLTNCYIYGGTWTIKRDGVYHIRGPASVTFDVPDASPTTTVNQFSPGSTVVVARGNVGTVDHQAGFMRTKGERAISIGATSYNRGPATLARTAFNDIDTIATPTTWGGQVAQIGEQPL